MIHAALYARVSTSDQSCAMQLAELRPCADSMVIRLAPFYYPNEYSGDYMLILNRTGSKPLRVPVWAFIRRYSGALYARDFTSRAAAAGVLEKSAGSTA